MDPDPGEIGRAANPEAAAVFGIQRATKEQAREERAILALTMEDVDLVGIREAARKAIQRVTQTTDGFALVLNASVARGMGDDPREAGLSTANARR
ncbi:MAG: hypothetical protein R3E51_08490 [Rhizobiaceae bacterium]